MPCETLVLPDGTTAIVCTRGQRTPRCSVPGCRNPGAHLCDHPLAGKKAGKTCDRRICAVHATKTGPDRDLCPAHAALSPSTQLGLDPSLFRETG